MTAWDLGSHQSTSYQVYALLMIMVKGETWRMQAIIWKYLVVSFSNM